ncbi:peptidoglycan-binding protein [Oscillatoriales cyanobacterium USR001]|nr:peptidoglycan-binding protein [Oscillatoriales cyanobacterium USR001]
MRVTTVAILSLLTFLLPGLSRSAIAANQTKSLTEQLEESGLLNPGGPIKPAFSDQSSQDKLFNKPFYEGLQQPQKKEKTLSKGDRGAEVAAVQKRLQAHGLNVGAIDGDFGSRTVSAVKEFQESQGLLANGIVNEATWTALKAGNENTAPIPVVTEKPTEKSTETNLSQIFTLGASGSKVKTLQVRLEMQGYNPGRIDGIFGARTLAAVKDFQEAYNLKADGVVDENTWQALSGK